MSIVIDITEPLDLSGATTTASSVMAPATAISSTFSAPTLSARSRVVPPTSPSGTTKDKLGVHFSLSAHGATYRRFTLDTESNIVETVLDFLGL